MEGKLASWALCVVLSAGACAEQVSFEPAGACVARDCLLDCLAAGYGRGECSASVCTCFNERPAEDGRDAGAEDGGAADAEADVVADRGTEARDDGDARTDGPDDGRYFACFPELGGECNLVEQCGCRVGQRCMLSEYGGEFCATAGRDPVGTPCGAADDCVPQNQCFAFLDGAPRCMQFCYTDADCPAGRSCLLPLSYDADYRVCADPPDGCDPFTGGGCTDGMGCLLLPGGPGASYCVPAGRVGPGGDCSVDACRVGSACYGTDPYAAPSCWKYCDLGDGDPGCAEVAGATCADVLGTYPIGLCWSW